MSERKAPPRIDEFDDDEADDTVVEPESAQSLSGAPVTQPAASMASFDDSDEDEATELLLTPPSRTRTTEKSGPVSASKSVVRLSGSPALADAFDEDDEDDDERTLALPSLDEIKAQREQAAKAEQERAEHPPIRPLSQVSSGDSEDRTASQKSSPRVVRMTFKPTESSGPRPAPAGETGGTLLIDAPAEAVVHIDGAAHPPGPVKLENVSRFARFKVRVMADGFAPWSATLSLNGKRAARIRPTLVKS